MTSQTSAQTESRLLGATATSYAQHIDAVGQLPHLDPASIRTLTEQAGLRGRGGGGFALAGKFAAVASTNGTPVLIANGAEGEPASSKDQFLLSHAPHLVIDGLVLAATATNAHRAYLYAPAKLLTAHVQPALAERRDPIDISTVSSADRFLSGEESAVVAAVARRAAIPSGRPEPVYRSGVDHQPTLVHNVETLAHLALLCRRGVEWFRSVGDPADPGTRLLTVSGSVRQPGVYECATNSSIEHVLSLAGGANASLQALLVGGYHGGWLSLTTPQLQHRLTFDELKQYGLAPGAGVIVALATEVCGLRETSRIVTYLAGESTQQCGPCFNGLPLIARRLHAISTRSATRNDIDELIRLLDVVEGRGACYHPTGVTRHVRSALTSFADELMRHQQGACIEEHAEKIGGI